MKCVIDPDLLFPPPVPGTLYFREMVLHEYNLTCFDLKVPFSDELMSELWAQWAEVRNRQHKRFLMQILTRHFAHDFPKEVEILAEHVTLTPCFIGELKERCRLEWLRSLAVCYDTNHSFNDDGVVLASWNREEFEGHQSVYFKYQLKEDEIPIKRNQKEWDLIGNILNRPPIPYNDALRIYADESSSTGNPEWIAVVVATEADVNRTVQSVTTGFNERLRVRDSGITDIHIRCLRTEQERLFAVKQVIKELQDIQSASFFIERKPAESETELYARGIGEVVGQWEESISTVYVDRPYDPASCNRKNIDLEHQIQNAVQVAGRYCRSDNIILGKSSEYPGLGIADAIAYLYRRRSEPGWRDIWQKFNESSVVKKIG